MADLSSPSRVALGGKTACVILEPIFDPSTLTASAVVLNHLFVDQS